MINKIKKNKGFVILFAVVISSMLLAIALGVANIALKEIKFSTSAKDTNEAFFAADIGAECALYWDKNPSAFGISTTTIPTCAGITNGLDLFQDKPIGPWNFTLIGLGSSGNGCVNVTLSRSTGTPPPVITTIVARGYNTGGQAGSNPTCNPTANSVERQIELNY